MSSLAHLKVSDDEHQVGDLFQHLAVQATRSDSSPTKHHYAFEASELNTQRISSVLNDMKSLFRQLLHGFKISSIGRRRDSFHCTPSELDAPERPG